MLEGAANIEGAQAVVEWLVGPAVQASVPDNMFMYPVSDEHRGLLSDTKLTRGGWGGVIEHDDVFSSEKQWCASRVRVRSVTTFC